MAAAVFTLTKVTQGTLGRGMFAVYNFTSDGGDYATGGKAPSGVNAFSSTSRYRREPDVVLFDANNGFVYGYDYTEKKILIRAQTNAAAEDAPLGELTDAAAVPAGARTGVKVIALWFTPVP